MRIILSPAKKMNDNEQRDEAERNRGEWLLGMPIFLQQTEEILTWMRSRSREELKKLWGCNDKNVWRDVRG